VITGGVFGMSLVNSIFVDAMVSDNNDNLERKIEELNKKMDRLLDK
ncbi:MAG: ion transporter, partial [Flavobacteriaceae bacterium]|nr:ion transporter [Flavobacteriaceae bacterium]